MAIHRMRTITAARDYIRKEDPETAVTTNSIRTLCKKGIVNCVYTGCKILVDLDNLLQVLGGESPDEEPTAWMIVPQKSKKEE